MISMSPAHYQMANGIIIIVLGCDLLATAAYCVRSDGDCSSSEWYEGAMNSLVVDGGSPSSGG